MNKLNSFDENNNTENMNDKLNSIEMRNYNDQPKDNINIQDQNDEDNKKEPENRLKLIKEEKNQAAQGRKDFYKDVYIPFKASNLDLKMKEKFIWNGFPLSERFWNIFCCPGHRHCGVFLAPSGPYSPPRPAHDPVHVS